MKTCETCRFWSNEQAQSIDWGPLEAVCLSQYSPKKGQMTKDSDTCECWSENTRGAVDDPNAGPYLEAEQPPEEKANMKPTIPTTPELDAAYVKFCDQYTVCIDCPLYRFSRRGSCLTAFKEAQAEVQAKAQKETL